MTYLWHQSVAFGIDLLIYISKLYCRYKQTLTSINYCEHVSYKYCKMRDDQAFNIMFVGLIEKNPCLYDNTREDYYLTYVQDEAWINLSRSIGDGATVAECKQRWKNLRGSYTKTLNGKTAPKRRYYLAPYMRYINPFTKSKKSKENSAIAEEKTLDVHESEEEITMFGDYIKQEVDEDDSLSQEDENQKTLTIDFNRDVIGDAAIRLEEVNVTTLADDKGGNTGKAMEYEPPVEYLESKNGAYVKPVIEDDADRYFLLSLLPDMKNMTDKQKRQFKISVLNIAAALLDK